VIEVLRAFTTTPGTRRRLQGILREHHEIGELIRLDRAEVTDTPDLVVGQEADVVA